MITAAQLDEVLAAEGPLLIYVWKPGCTTCRFVTPRVEELTPESAPGLRVRTLELKEAGPLMQRFGLTRTPALLFFSGGELRETVVGAIPKTAFAERVARLSGCA